MRPNASGAVARRRPRIIGHTAEPSSEIRVMNDPTDQRHVGDHADKLSRIRPLAHDEDERPSREDRGYGQTIFSRPPVPLPRFLTGRRKPRDA
jgi:hypothetical protein